MPQQNSRSARVGQSIRNGIYSITGAVSSGFSRLRRAMRRPGHSRYTEIESTHVLCTADDTNGNRVSPTQPVPDSQKNSTSKTSWWRLGRKPRSSTTPVCSPNGYTGYGTAR